MLLWLQARCIQVSTYCFTDYDLNIIYSALPCNALLLILCFSGTSTVGQEVKTSAGCWGASFVQVIMKYTSEKVTSSILCIYFFAGGCLNQMGEVRVDRTSFPVLRLHQRLKESVRLKVVTPKWSAQNYPIITRLEQISQNWEN